MLPKFPKEILLPILNLLTFEDKLNMIQTCREWRNVISEGYLYMELRTFDSEQNLQKALDVFRNNPNYGYQVNELDISINCLSKKSLFQLPSVLPNIKKFRAARVPWNIPEEEVKSLLDWKDTLEEYYARNGNLLITPLLDKYVFSRLSSIKMNLHCMFQLHLAKANRSPQFRKKMNNPNRTKGAYEVIMSPGIAKLFSRHNKQFFACFKNMPCLTQLALFDTKLYVEYLESLHTVCPQLTSLSLSLMDLCVADSDGFSLSVAPATQLHTLKLEKGLYVENSQNAVLEYFTAKYTKLTEFIFLGGFIEDKPTDPWDSGRRHNTLSDECLRKRREFISSIPSTIKILKLNTDAFPDSAAILKESTLKPVELGFYGYDNADMMSLTAMEIDVQQLDYLKGLDSLHSLTLDWNNTKVKCYYGKWLDSTLNRNEKIPNSALHNNGYPLDVILSASPSIKSLVLSKKNVFRDNSCPITIKNPHSCVSYPNLRKLWIDQPIINHKVIEFIRTALPNLKELILTLYFTDAASGINLEGCNLDVFDFVLHVYSAYDYYVELYLQVKTLRKLQNYEVAILNDGEIGWVNELNDFRPNDKTFTIICDSINILKLRNLNIRSYEKFKI